MLDQVQQLVLHLGGEAAEHRELDERSWPLRWRRDWVRQPVAHLTLPKTSQTSSSSRVTSRPVSSA